MELEEYKKRIHDAFKDYEFFDSTHTYFYKGQKVSISTTGLIGQYENEFDKWEMSAKVASKRGITQLEVLDEWNLENLHSTIKGSMIHEFAQSLWEGKDYIFNYDNLPEQIDKQRLQVELLNMSKQAIKFYNDYKDLYDLVGCEIYLGVPDYDECGATDMILMNKFTKGIWILDFKSNKKIDYESFGHKKMKTPLNKYEDCNFVHYSIQLNAYDYKLKYMTGIKASEKALIYFDCTKEDYQLIEPLSLEKEVKELYENRRVKNMNSIGVLIQGNSGTGKSTSLRNLPAEETAIINVTNKVMPFRNKNGINIVNCSNYEQIIDAIIKTKKRIIVVDDSSYLMTFENFEKATVKSYDKFTTMAVNYYNLLKTPQKCDGEKIIYFITHEEIDENNISHPKTIGKMLSQQLVIEGLFSIVLRSMIKNGEYVFQTHNDGTSVCKSPIDMFTEDFVPNDLLEVDKIIRDYYEFQSIGNKNE